MAAPASSLEVPELTARVMDRASVLAPQTRASLERRLAEYERETGHQIVVHTTPSLEGLEIEEYSIRVAEAWKVGHKQLENGVILTVAPEDRDLRIEVGYGLEGVMPDAIAFRIIRDHIVPEFRAGNLEQGILAGTTAIMQAASGEVLPVPRSGPRSERRERGGGFPVWAYLILILLAFGSRGFFFWPFLGGVLGSDRSSGGFRSGGGFSGGFGGGGFSGGGGGFGGGGASGSW